MKAEVHLDFNLFGENPFPLRISSNGDILLKSTEVILDPSVLYYLVFHQIKEAQITYYLPENMMRLIARSREDLEYREFLASFLTYFRDAFGVKVGKDLQLFYNNIEQMNIKTISSDNFYDANNKENYYEDYSMIFSNHPFYISMSPMLNFLGDYIAKILNFSKQNGILILSKSRKLANILREKVISIELPKHLMQLSNHIKGTPNQMDNLLKVKSDIINRMFDFKGGRTTKFFIAVSLGVWGLRNPIAGVLSVAFVFIDP